MIYKLILMSLVGGAIGWLTNIIAIKLLFRPLQPVNLLFFKVQGLIPKRRVAIVHSVAEVIEKELLDMEQIFDSMIEKIDKQAILEKLEVRIVEALVSNLPSLMQAFSSSIERYVHEIIEQKGEALLNEAAEHMLHKVVTEVSVAELVEGRLLSYDVEKIESIILQLSKTELVQIERLGGILGLIVGFVQGLLVLYVM